MSAGLHTFHAPSVLAISIVLPVLDVIAVALRLHARKKQKVAIGADDYLSVAALVFTLGCAATLIAGTALHAVGYPTPFVDLTNASSLTTVNRYIQITSQCEWALNLLSVIALGLIKLSFLFFLRRVFCTRVQPNAIFRTVLWGMIGLVSIWTVAFFFAWLFICRGDFAAWWGPYLGVLEKCPHAYLLLYGTGVSDVVLDGIVILLPLPIIFSLNLGLKKKLAISALFMIGLLVLAVSLTRLVVILASSSTAPGLDEDLFITQYLWWTMFEVGMALLASCLSNLRPLVPEISGHKILESLKATYSRVSLSRARRSGSEDIGRKETAVGSVERLHSRGSSRSFAKVRGASAHSEPLPHFPAGQGIWVQRDIQIHSVAGHRA